MNEVVEQLLSKTTERSRSGYHPCTLYMHSNGTVVVSDGVSETWIPHPLFPSCVRVCIHMYVYLCGGLSSSSGTIYFFYYEGRVTHWPGTSQVDKTGWVPGTCFSDVRITSVCHHMWPFRSGVLGIPLGACVYKGSILPTDPSLWYSKLAS